MAAAAVLAFMLIPLPQAGAHPLGNFTINHYHGLVLTPDRVEDHLVIDAAEIPTVQQRDSVDTNGDGTVSGEEAAAFAEQECETVASQVKIAVGGRALTWKIDSSNFTYSAGAAGLDISRLECDLTADADLNEPVGVSFVDQYLSDRIGWREITAAGDGIALTDPPVPSESISDELRNYPNGLLSSPLDQRSVELQAAPGRSSDVGLAPQISEPGWTTRVLGTVTDKLDEMVGGDVTVQVGLLAVLLSLILGASHAALPGHGKTIMAAYMVGARGTPKDAVLIGATVTLAHTTGVLVLGALFSASATFAGETLLAVLGVISGLLVAAIGVGLVRSALRGGGYMGLNATFGAGHGHGEGHGHGHGHGQAYELEHGDELGLAHESQHGHGHVTEPKSGSPADDVTEVMTGAESSPATSGATMVATADLAARRADDSGSGERATHPHTGDDLGQQPHDRAAHPDHLHGHDHGDLAQHQHDQLTPLNAHPYCHDHGDLPDHEHAGHEADGIHADASPDAVPHDHHRAARGYRRLTLVGMGLAGGLVPSPSALIVLLGAIALGRTAFGVLLVVGYGIGMAATLTAVGYFIAKLPTRMGRLRGLTSRPGWSRLVTLGPILTAGLVLVVGIGLALRSAAPLL